MPCLGCKSILTQAIVIVIAGAVIGVADSQMRPVKLDRTIPPAPPVAPTPGPAPAPGPKPPVAPPDKTTPAPFVEKPASELPPGQITISAAKALYDKQAVFIDARKVDKYALGHVKGSYRISEEDFRSGNPPILAVIPRESTLVVYCSGGHCDESEQVARLLDGSGYKTIYVMHDGFPGWQAMGFPSETGEGLQ